MFTLRAVHAPSSHDALSCTTYQAMKLNLKSRSESGRTETRSCGKFPRRNSRIAASPGAHAPPARNIFWPGIVRVRRRPTMAVTTRHRVCSGGDAGWETRWVVVAEMHGILWEEWRMRVVTDQIGRGSCAFPQKKKNRWLLPPPAVNVVTGTGRKRARHSRCDRDTFACVNRQLFLLQKKHPTGYYRTVLIPYMQDMVKVQRRWRGEHSTHAESPLPRKVGSVDRNEGVRLVE